MRLSLLTLLVCLHLPTTGFAAFTAINTSFLNDDGFGEGTGSGPILIDSNGAPLEHNDVYQIVVWGNVGLTPADAGWDWGDYIAVTGEGSLNPGFDSRIVRDPGFTNDQPLFTNAFTFSDQSHNVPPSLSGGRVGLVIFASSTTAGASRTGVFDPAWVAPPLTNPAPAPLLMDVDASNSAGSLVWQNNAPFIVPEDRKSVV